MSSKKPKPDQNFDWAAYESGYTVERKAQIDQMYQKSFQSLTEKAIVNAAVTAITKKDVIVSLKQKSEGTIPVTEFRYNPELKVGDQVMVYVEKLEDKNGLLILSHKKARATEAWAKVNEVLESQEIISGYVKSRTKGGLIVDIFGIEAFLPGSQIDIKPIRDYDIYVNKNIQLKVIKINHEFKNIVVSHKILIEDEIQIQKQQIISGLEKGQILEGVVKNLTDYGVFVDLGGIDGLIHITDLSWGRVAYPSEIVKVDEKIRVVILDFDKEKNRIALGLKQLTAHPWESLDENLKVGDIVEGRITQLYDYGAFMEITPGIEGLIHVSEMSWAQHLRSAQEFFKIGEVAKAKILSIEKEDRKISLSIKQLSQDPWENVEQKFAVGTKHNVTIRNFTNYGVFAELAQGIEGILHIEDISWLKVKHPSEVLQLGQQVEMLILSLDKTSRKVHLGYKQLQENPWEKLDQMFKDSTLLEGKVAEIKDKHAVIAFENIDGTCPIKHLVRENKVAVQKGDLLSFMILEISQADKRLIVSHAATYNKEMEIEGKSDKRKLNAKKVETRGTSLNDLDILTELKNQLSEK